MASSVKNFHINIISVAVEITVLGVLCLRDPQFMDLVGMVGMAHRVHK